MGLVLAYYCMCGLLTVVSSRRKETEIELERKGKGNEIRGDWYSSQSSNWGTS